MSYDLHAVRFCRRGLFARHCMGADDMGVIVISVLAALFFAALFAMIAEEREYDA